jgi:DNA-binding GntR family transcriptional regulator
VKEDMVLELNRNSGETLHQQLKKVILRKIEKGEYKSDETIPSIAQLCSLYQVSSITVRKTISELVAEGFLKSIPGKGTFVTGIKPEKSRGTRKPPARATSWWEWFSPTLSAARSSWRYSVELKRP